MSDHQNLILALIEKHQPQLLADWMSCLTRGGRSGAGPHRDNDTPAHAKRFIEQLRQGVRNGQFQDISASELGADARVAGGRVAQPGRPGHQPQPRPQPSSSPSRSRCSNCCAAIFHDDADLLAQQIWQATQLLDQLGLFTIECYQRTREELIGRQQQELLELSTPVVQLWDGILALPLIGTLDSARTQIVMESLLQRIVTSGAEIAIIDITGVPTVDTLVAQHLIKTISAARLMGADCILSGIRPQIAQTIVHLGLELNVISKATMADALRLALHRTRKTIVDRATAAAREA